MLQQKAKTKPTISSYIALTKPGIIAGNIMPALAGFILASSSYVDLYLLFFTLFGLFCVIASACVMNNCIDVELDKKMERTQKRPLPLGIISIAEAYTFGAIVAAIGFTTLAATTNQVTVNVAAFGFVVYVFLYSFLKYVTTHSTLIGSLAGAVPPVVGYTAVTGHLDWTAFSFYMVMVAWQMPHFYAIALRRIDDYRAGDIPVYPIARGMLFTKLQILLYILPFGYFALQLESAPYYQIGMAVTTLVWLYLAASGFKAKNTNVWARRIFLFSLIAVMVLNVTLCLSHFL